MTTEKDKIIEEIKEFNKDNWNDVNFPNWIPIKFYKGIVEFWSCFDRTPKDYYNYLLEKVDLFKCKVTAKCLTGDKIVYGLYLPRYNNVGCVIPEIGEAEYSSEPDILSNEQKALQSQKQNETEFLEEVIRNMMLECIRYAGDDLTNSYKLVADRLELLKSIGEKEQ